ARILFRLAAGGRGYGSRLADGNGLLQPSHVARALSWLLVHGRLVAGQDFGNSPEAERRELHGDERDISGGQSAQCHGPGCGPGWLAVFLHRRPRDERRNLSRDVARASAEGCNGHRHWTDGRDPTAAAGEQLG